jgi:hypothetical protein
LEQFVFFADLQPELIVLLFLALFSCCLLLFSFSTRLLLLLLGTGFLLLLLLLLLGTGFLLLPLSFSIHCSRLCWASTVDRHLFYA